MERKDGRKTSRSLLVEKGLAIPEAGQREIMAGHIFVDGKSRIKQAYAFPKPS